MNLMALYPRLEELLARMEASISCVWGEESGFSEAAARWMLSGRGKRLRPSLLLLSAECAGGATESSVAMAGVTEVVHTASLAHDDVVDDAAARRGRRSANAVWGNKLSVLLGDYLVARAFAMVPEEDRGRYVMDLTRVATRMCEGQMRELRAVGRVMEEGEYFEVVREKTGSLFRFCGEVGARTAGGPEAWATALGEFGERFGVAFQIADDVLDLMGTEGESGKPEARDLAEGKVTLPLMAAAELGGEEVRAEIERIVRSGSATGEEVEWARRTAESTGAIGYCWEQVRKRLETAQEQLMVVPESGAKEALMVAVGRGFPMPVMA